MKTITWIVRAYEKNGDKLLEEFVLSDINVNELRMVLGNLPVDKVCEIHKIIPANAGFFENLIRKKFDFLNIEYFLECWTE